MSCDLVLRKAMECRRIDSYPFDEMLDKATKLLTQCYALAGFKQPDKYDLAMLINKVASDLIMSYPGMTVEEVAFCFEMGIKGEYGETVGINMRSITQWLKAYQKSALRYKIKLELQHEAERRALPPVSPETREAEERRYLDYVFRQYKAGYPLERFHVARIYRILQERGIIHHTPEEKWAAVRLFERYKPETRGNLPIDEELRMVCVKSKAMEWLLRKEFDKREKLF